MNNVDRVKNLNLFKIAKLNNNLFKFFCYKINN